MCFQVFGKSGNAASNIFSWRGVVLLFYLFAPCAAEVRGHFQPPDAAGRNSVPLLRGTWAEHMFADSRALTLAVEGQILPTRYRKQLTATKHEAQCKALSQLNKKEFIKKTLNDFQRSGISVRVCVTERGLCFSLCFGRWSDEISSACSPGVGTYTHTQTLTTGFQMSTRSHNVAYEVKTADKNPPKFRSLRWNVCETWHTNKNSKHGHVLFISKHIYLYCK